MPFNTNDIHFSNLKPDDTKHINVHYKQYKNLDAYEVWFYTISYMC